jgi:hypothetical protein
LQRNPDFIGTGEFFSTALLHQNRRIYIVQNFNTIMKQAKKMQERMANLQKELEMKTVEAQAGGGMVRVVVNGKYEIVSLKIEKEVVNPEDIEMLQDLIAAAVNEGIRKAQEMSSSEMAKITGGLNIPGL